MKLGITNRRPPARRSWLVRLLARIFVLATIAVALVAVVTWVGTRVTPLPDELLHPADRTLILLDYHDRELAILPSGRARVAEALPLRQMGRWLPAVTVALEDRRFWQHDGIDLRALLGAAWQNLRFWRVVSGASTIEQQLIKATRGRRGPRWWNKIAENFAARRLAREWPRERILEEYLNRIEYGNRRIGPNAAARAYFDKAPTDLTMAEAVFLAGLPQAPTRFNPWSRPDAALERYRRSVRVLAATRVIDPVAERELSASPPIVTHHLQPEEAPHFVEMIRKRSPGLHGRVRTTLDLELQRAATNLVREHVAALRARGVTQAAVVVLDNRDGAVRAMVGSAGLLSPGGQINGAMLPRSCGSVLKPFLYLQAIQERKLTAASALPDTPDAIHLAYGDYDPRNFDRRFAGPVRVREALGNSLNVPAVYTLSQVGARSFFTELGRWGFQFPRDLRDYGAGLILGNAELRLVDLAAAFAGIAAQGCVPTWRLLEDEPVRRRVVASPESCAIIADILCDDEARRRSFGRDSALCLPVRVPCKTGTSSGFRDAWTVGATAQHTVAVWVGNFDGRTMDAAASIEAAAPLWRAVVELLLPTDDGVPAPVPSVRLVDREICRLTGRIPTERSPGTMHEWFLSGTEPRDSANVWLRLDARGAPRLVLPREYAAWCASGNNFLGAITEPPSSITIRVPANGATFTLDPDLPASQQMLKFEAEVPPGAAVAWEVDGKPVRERDGTVLWPLRAGSHTLTITTDTARATSGFTVGPTQ
jgi:penicillin-binding protein 1C